MTITRLRAQMVVADPAATAWYERPFDRAGVAHDGPVDVTASRVRLVTDPDGNQIVFTERSRRNDRRRGVTPVWWS